jgi:hypothetical protein
VGVLGVLIVWKVAIPSIVLGGVGFGLGYLFRCAHPAGNLLDRRGDDLSSAALQVGPTPGGFIRAVEWPDPEV